MCELDDESGEELDHDVRHFHRAHCKGHHTLLGTAVNEASLKALNQFPLQGRKEINVHLCVCRIAVCQTF